MHLDYRIHVFIINIQISILYTYTSSYPAK